MIYCKGHIYFCIFCFLYFWWFPNYRYKQLPYNVNITAILAIKYNYFAFVNQSLAAIVCDDTDMECKWCFHKTSMDICFVSFKDRYAIFFLLVGCAIIIHHFVNSVRGYLVYGFPDNCGKKWCSFSPISAFRLRSHGTFSLFIYSLTV